MRPVPPVLVEPPASSPLPRRVVAADALADRLRDASVRPPGHAAAVWLPATEEAASACLASLEARGAPVLFQAARTSLTGGAVPDGDEIVSVERLDGLGEPEPVGDVHEVRVGAGVRLRDLCAALHARGFDYPPVPTYREAMLGGTAATNAGGASTFLHGTTRDWITGLRVVLADGRRLAVRRGDAVAGPGESFEIDGGVTTIPRPEHRLPAVRKVSAGYHSAPRLDLVDLFVGSEGTLGLIAEVTLRVVPRPPGRIGIWAFVPDEDAALELAAELRERPRDGALAVRGVEYVDPDGVGRLRTGDAARAARVSVPASPSAALWIDLEARASGFDAERQALLERLLAVAGDHVFVAEDEAGRAALGRLREAVPLAVFEELSRRAATSPGVHKLGGDTVVPPERLGAFLRGWREGLRDAGLRGAVWGHLADGNLHPNVVARDVDEMRRGERLLLEAGRLAIRLGGAPLAEHGVGRHPGKQRLLREFLGEPALERMRAVKRALDPGGRLARGVLLPPPL